MKRRLALFAGMAAVGGAVYVGCAYYVGSVITSQVGLYERRLLAIEGVSVTRLEYDNRILGGEFVYDVSWRPPREHPLGDWLRTAVEPNSAREIRVAGRLPVRHGPWVGRLAAARAAIRAPLPGHLRELLPKYPGQAPWVEVDAVLDWTRDLAVDFRVVDYTGSVGRPDVESSSELVLDGLTVRVRFAQEVSRALVEIDLRRLGVGDPAFSLELRDARLKASGSLSAPYALRGELAVDAIAARAREAVPVNLSAGPLRLSADALREWSYIWSGTSTLELGKVELDVSGSRAALDSLKLRDETLRRGSRVGYRSSLEVGPSTVAGVRLPPLILQSSTDALDGESLDRLLEAYWSATFGSGPMANAMLERIPELASRVIAAGGRISLDRLALSVRDPGDVGISMSAAVPAGTRLSFELPELPPDQLESLSNAVDARLTATADLRSIEELFVLTAALGAAIEGGAPMGAGQDAVARANFARVRSALDGQTLFTVDGDALRLEARISGGGLELNGRKAAALEAQAMLGQLAEAMGALLWPPDPALAGANVGPATPNPGAAPSFGRVSLAADFAPDPRVFELTAGGSDVLGAELGPDCFGHVDASRPDLELDYQAGRFVLFVYAQASEDTALIVRTPDGEWSCNDDGPNRGLDPTVQIPRPVSGKYAIWVASIAPHVVQATLFVSEADPDPNRAR